MNTDIVKSDINQDIAATAALSAKAFEEGDVTLALASAPSWAGGVGDVVSGTLVAIEVQVREGRTKSEGDLVYPVVTLKTDGGLIKIHAIPTVTRDALKERKPQIGDSLRFVNLGDRESKAGVTYHLTMLVPEEAAVQGAFDWDSL